MRICVFLSAAILGEPYVEDTRRFARRLVAGGHSLVWGGSDVGLMKVLADEVARAGGALHGVSVDFLGHLARQDADTMLIAPNLGARKAAMLAAADAVAVLVGGTGTLDEATELLELKKHGQTSVEVAFVNTDGFYDGLRAQYQRMHDEGLTSIALDDLAYFAPSGLAAVEYLEKAAAAS